MATDVTDVGEATDLVELRCGMFAFINWVSRNNLSDPDCMLVCAEWFNLCGAV